MLTRKQIVAVGAALFGVCAAAAYRFLQEPFMRAVGTVQMVQRVKEWPSPSIPGTSFCMVHRAAEELVGSYTDCGECGHVYETYEALREAHALVYRNIGGKKQIGMISYCPLCLHDFS